MAIDQTRGSLECQADMLPIELQRPSLWVLSEQKQHPNDAIFLGKVATLLLEILGFLYWYGLSDIDRLYVFVSDADQVYGLVS